MTETLKLIWNGYRYLPYEREFARREVEALTGNKATEIPGGIAISAENITTYCSQLHRLTYFRYILLPDGTRLIPDQVRLEESHGANHEQDSLPLMTKQSTRYSAHGLHQYRGKFNPQVVRAIGNILNLPVGAWVLDPFCGSGTTLLECNHIGWNAIGIDLNPLGVLISNSKILALQTPPELLRAEATRLSERLRKGSGTLTVEGWTESEVELLVGCHWTKQLPNFSYLAVWFPKLLLAKGYGNS